MVDRWKLKYLQFTLLPAKPCVELDRIACPNRCLTSKMRSEKHRGKHGVVHSSAVRSAQTSQIVGYGFDFTVVQLGRNPCHLRAVVAGSGSVSD